MAGVCASTLINQTSTTQTVSQTSNQNVNSTQTATSNLTTTNSKNTNEVSATSNNATTNTGTTNLSNQTTTTNPVVKPIRNATIDTSILSATASITYTCPDGNVLVFSVNQNNPNTVTLLGFKTKKVSELVIPNVITTSSDFYAVTAIAPGAFYGQGITSVTFNHSLQTIGTLAFANNNLSSLTFPPNLQSIGDRAFISNQFPHAYAVYLPLNTT
ncbi:leucine-rich repeat protein [bacterium]|nr:leucine-rich repeat protein [bacterium]